MLGKVNISKETGSEYVRPGRQEKGDETFMELEEKQVMP